MHHYFHMGGSLSQPVDKGVADTRWQVRMTQQLTTEEYDDGVDPKDTIAQRATLATYSGDDGNDEKEVFRLAPPDTPSDAPLVVWPIVCRNPP